ncbi:MAG TPA: hypothetical protein VKA91_05680 [Nitrososphaeraceae archaeon]|nr:hypothetical protein [Nitrososphaeraceae archaeon]
MSGPLTNSESEGRMFPISSDDYLSRLMMIQVLQPYHLPAISVNNIVCDIDNSQIERYFLPKIDGRNKSAIQKT